MELNVFSEVLVSDIEKENERGRNLDLLLNVRIEWVLFLSYSTRRFIKLVRTFPQIEMYFHLILFRYPLAPLLQFKLFVNTAQKTGMPENRDWFWSDTSDQSIWCSLKLLATFSHTIHRMDTQLSKSDF